MSIEELEILSKYINIRLRGTFEVEASSREEACKKVRDRILEEILVQHPSFAETGLPNHWEEWLEEQTEKMLGIEVIEEDESVQESLDISWTNIKGGKMYKDGTLSHGIDHRRRKKK